MRLSVLLLALVAGSAWLHSAPVHLPRNCAAPSTGLGYAAVPRGHAHNDYRHPRPLISALRRGFTSVEADVWPVHGRLLVAHDRAQVDATRSLESLYLDPLARAFRAGQAPADEVHAGVQLLVDVKGDPASTLPLLRTELASYADMLTHYRATDDGCTAAAGPVSVVVSGNARPATLQPGTTSLLGYDEPISPDRQPRIDEAVTPLASGDWADWFTWDGHGRMPAGEHDRLVDMVTAAHAAGSRIRFWDTPDDPGPAREAVWRELAADGVDYINTDDLAGYAAFARSSGAGSVGRVSP